MPTSEPCNCSQPSGLPKARVGLGGVAHNLSLFIFALVLCLQLLSQLCVADSSRRSATRLAGRWNSAQADIILTWKDHFVGESGFLLSVDRKIGQGKSAKFKAFKRLRLGANLQRYVHKVVPGRYQYRIRPVGSPRWRYSNFVRITVPSGGRRPTPTHTPIAVATPAPTPGPVITPTASPTPVPVPPVSQPLLQPGSGWSGPLAVPTPIGGAGDEAFDAKVMAHWDVVPFQTFNSGEFFVGVVAFHYNGIAGVRFSVNDGPWVEVTEMSLNPQTNVWEYVARLRASDFGDQSTVEVRAVAIPQHAGVPRMLSGPIRNSVTTGENSLVLFAHFSAPTDRYVSAARGNDSSGNGTSQSPFRSIQRAFNSLTLPSDDGARILLLDQDPAGWQVLRRAVSYSYPLNYLENERWITIMPAPGQSPMRISQRAGNGYLETDIQRIKFQDLTIDFHTVIQMGNAAYNTSLPNALTSFWQERVVWEGPGYGIEGPQVVRGIESNVAWYTTDSSSHDHYSGPVGHVLVRNTHLERITGDLFTNTKLVVSSSANNYIGNCEPCNIHPDNFQYYGSQYYAGVYDDGEGNHRGATWDGSTRILSANPGADYGFPFVLTPDHRLIVISGTGVVRGSYEIEEVIDSKNLRLRRSITVSPETVDLNIGDIFAVATDLVDNVIVYGFKGSNQRDVQNWHYDYGNHRNHAFVNIALENTEQGVTANYIGYDGAHHILMMNVSAVRKLTFFHEGISLGKVVNSVFETVGGVLLTNLPAGVLVQFSHLNTLLGEDGDNISNTTVGAPYESGNQVGRQGRGSVQVAFDGSTPGGRFQYTGRDAPNLLDTGTIMPGFRNWPWADLTNSSELRHKGAFEFER